MSSSAAPLARNISVGVQNRTRLTSSQAWWVWLNPQSMCVFCESRSSGRISENITSIAVASQDLHFHWVTERETASGRALINYDRSYGELACYSVSLEISFTIRPHSLITFDFNFYFFCLNFSVCCSVLASLSCPFTLGKHTFKQFGSPERSW